MLKEFLLPPGSIILVLVALFLLFRRRAGATRALLFATAAALYLLSTPCVARLLTRSLQWYPPITPGEGPPAEAIIVLAAGRYRDVPIYGGDTVDALTLERLRFAARLHHATGLPVLSSGGPPHDAEWPRPMAALMAECLERDFRVGTNWLEAASTNTAENALFSAERLAEHSIQRAYVVTHAWHLPRAMLAFRGTGLAAIPAAASHASAQPLRPGHFVPNARALAETAYALHEWVGMGWYRIRYGFPLAGGS